jgi:hypothetical protein
MTRAEVSSMLPSFSLQAMLATKPGDEKDNVDGKNGTVYNENVLLYYVMMYYK